jgi:hypothetical protein
VRVSAIGENERPPPVAFFLRVDVAVQQVAPQAATHEDFSASASSKDVRRVRNIATELLNKFSQIGLRELDQSQPEGWAKESYEIATKIAHENGSLRGTPKGLAHDCRAVNAVMYLSRDYPV